MHFCSNLGWLNLENRQFGWKEWLILWALVAQYIDVSRSSKGMSICSISSTCNQIIRIIILLLLLLHLVLLPLLAVEEDPVGALLPVLLIVTLTALTLSELSSAQLHLDLLQASYLEAV